MRMIEAASLVAVCGMLVLRAPARADWVPPFKGNDTGGIIAYSLAGRRYSCARDRSLRVLRQGGEISRRRSRIMAVTFPLPAAGCPMARPGPVRSRTERPNDCFVDRFDGGARPHDATAFLALALGFCLLALLPADRRRADELPVRKAGLWEMKMVRTGSPLPEMTMQHCTDETTDKEMSTCVLADVEGDLLQARHPENRDRLCLAIPSAASAASR